MTDGPPDVDSDDAGVLFPEPAPGASPVDLPRTGPLADRMRPTSLDQVAGQDAILGATAFLRTAAEAGAVPSLVLWGPPGSGKTTIARCLAASAKATFVALSAVTSGVKDVRAVIDAAQKRRRAGGRTLLFVDEIHRFNKAQQDAFLPHVEAGTVVLIGATTENPSFALTSALLSRLRVVVLAPLSTEALARVVDRALSASEGLGGRFALDPEAKDLCVEIADGDARRCLNYLESAAEHATGRGTAPRISAEDVREGAQSRRGRYDRAGEAHFDSLSAFHKSLRASDVDAALYWMARMLDGGEDPLVIVRRMVAMASEDVGLADNEALHLALAAKDAVDFLGVPEGELAMVHAVIYLATAPKSNSVVTALLAAKKAAESTPSAAVPLHIRNAPTKTMKDLGYGEGYKYPHDDPAGFASQYLPDEMKSARFYEPHEIGDEREISKRLAYWRRLRET